jgi:hypothetical protein
MAIKQKKPVAFPRTAIKALELLDRPQAEILLHDSKAYVICRDKCLYLPDKPYQALVSQDWITSPVAIDDEHAYCVITASGRAKVEAMRNGRTGYTQEAMFDTSQYEVARDQQKTVKNIQQRSFEDMLKTPPSGRSR